MRGSISTDWPARFPLRNRLSPRSRTRALQRTRLQFPSGMGRWRMRVRCRNCRSSRRSGSLVIRVPPRGVRLISSAPVEESRDLVTKLPEFDIAGVKQLGPNVAALDGVNADRERLTVPGSLRTRVGAAKQVANAVRQLEALAAALDVAARAAAQQLTLPRALEMGQITDCLAHGGIIARTGAGPRGWWDAGRRKELLVVVARAGEQDRAAQAARTELVTRFSPVAFGLESSATVREAARAGRSFWSRLFPRWWGLQKQVSAWYVGTPAGGAALRVDIAKLTAYHQNADAVQQIVTAYGVELVKDSADKPHWSETADGLRAAEELAAWGVKYEALSRQDRKLLGDAIETLRQAQVSFEQSAATVGREFVLPDLLKKTPAEVRAWLAGEALALDREAEGLQALAGLLAAGQDVQGKRIREAAATVSRLATVAATMRLLEEGQPTDEKVRTERAALGTALLGFLDRWKHPLTPQLTAVLTERIARERVSPAIKHNETARGGNFGAAWDHITRSVFDPDAEVSSGVVLNRVAAGDLARWASARATDADRLFEWVRFVHAEREANATGVGGVLDEVRAGEFPVERAADAFRARFFRLWLDALHQQVPVLGEFATDKHERLVAKFADLDRLAVRTAADRVRAVLLAKTDRPQVRDGAPDASELGILLREVNKKRRHLPLRHLFAKVPTLLPRIKPCLMMSPLAVSSYLDNPELTFDLVIFDEASQVRPHDAVCAIYRAKQLVVGGDPKQLPPTDFFTRTGEEADDSQLDDGGTAAFESLLDVCLSLGLCRKRLRWHYRSRREGLIAFSNRHFYGGSLVTFPSADAGALGTGSAIRPSRGRRVQGRCEPDRSEAAWRHL